MHQAAQYKIEVIYLLILVYYLILMLFLIIYYVCGLDK